MHSSSMYCSCFPRRPIRGCDSCPDLRGRQTDRSYACRLSPEYNLFRRRLSDYQRVRKLPTTPDILDPRFRQTIGKNCAICLTGCGSTVSVRRGKRLGRLTALIPEDQRRLSGPVRSCPKQAASTDPTPSPRRHERRCRHPEHRHSRTLDLSRSRRQVKFDQEEWRTNHPALRGWAEAIRWWRRVYRRGTRPGMCHRNSGC